MIRNLYDLVAMCYGELWRLLHVCVIWSWKLFSSFWMRRCA